MKSFQFAFIILGIIVLASCGNVESSDTSVHDAHGAESENANSYNEEQDVSPNGTYVYSEDNFEARMTVSGNSWSGVTTIYGDVQYDNGVARGNSIYDESGLVEIGQISNSGLVTVIGSSRVTLRKR